MNQPIEFVSTAPPDLAQFIKVIRSKLKPGLIILLYGPMGAGKTHLVKALLKQISDEAVSSPTFAIHQQYQSQICAIEHVDLYRLQSDAEIEASGFWDLLGDNHKILIIEWADRLGECKFPLGWAVAKLSIELVSPEVRKYVYIEI